MNKDRTKGRFKSAAASAKETTGKMLDKQAIKAERNLPRHHQAPRGSRRSQEEYSERLPKRPLSNGVLPSPDRTASPYAGNPIFLPTNFRGNEHNPY